jgi:hypothetical protein
MPRPHPSEYASSYGPYLALVPEEDILAAMASELARTLALLGAVPDEVARVCHPPHTWTTKQVVGHLADSERIFGYRALCVARGDSTSLPGFDENAYAQAGDFDQCSLSDLVAEFQAVRQSCLCLFKNLSATRWSQHGTANGNDVSVRALAYIIVGHERHHTAILRQRLSASTS